MDLQHLRASDGTGEAVLAHVQSVRNPGSTVLDLDNVDNWNSKCVVVTGTPATNGFISPTGMTVMYGHITAGDFIIDGYAPGYSDNGNLTTEVAFIKMTTSWADTLVTLLGNALADTGFLKTTSLDHFYKPTEISPTSFVASGGIVAQTAGLTGSFSDIVYYVAGLRYTKTGVVNKAYTASKDTYVDIGIDGTVDYNEVANGAASPAIAADHIRVAKVVTSGAAITRVSQTTTGLPYYDSLLNIIRPIYSVDTTNKVWIPDYANQEATDRWASATTWTCDRRGFVYFFVYSYNTSAPQRARVLINGKIANESVTEAYPPNNARVTSNSGILPVAPGDVIAISNANSINERDLFFIPGRWT